MKPTLGIGADHAGYEYKQVLITYLEAQGYSVKDFGTDSPDSVDYPDYVHPLASEVETGKLDLGILICGSGNGVCMAANKHKNVRAALVWQVELAELARQHNNANVVCIPARFISMDLAKKITDAFLTTEFEGGRHQRRVDKIAL